MDEDGHAEEPDEYMIHIIHVLIIIHTMKYSATAGRLEGRACVLTGMSRIMSARPASAAGPSRLCDIFNIIFISIVICKMCHNVYLS